LERRYKINKSYEYPPNVSLPVMLHLRKCARTYGIQAPIKCEPSWAFKSAFGRGFHMSRFGALPRGYRAEIGATARNFGLPGPLWASLGVSGCPRVSQGVPGCPSLSQGTSNITFNYIMYVFSDILRSRVKCQKRRTLYTIKSLEL
jgi:hypothetical protein